MPTEGHAWDDLLGMVTPYASPRNDAIEWRLASLIGRLHDAGALAVMAAAMMTGDRAAISDDVNTAMKNSGLAHLISISGLHMGLATGIIFFGVRAGLALIEPIALTQPIKKWAAGAALVSGFLYLLISGGAWPAQRCSSRSSSCCARRSPASRP